MCNTETPVHVALSSGTEVAEARESGVSQELNILKTPDGNLSRWHHALPFLLKQKVLNTFYALLEDSGLPFWTSITECVVEQPGQLLVLGSPSSVLGDHACHFSCCL